MSKDTRPDGAPAGTVLARHREALMALPDVVGTALGLHDGQPCIQVLVSRRSPALERSIPERIEGVAVSIVVTGPLRPLGGNAPG